MIFFNHLDNALKSLRRNRVRTFLTAFGITVGVASITLILSLSSGLQDLFTGQISNFGQNLIIVRPVSSRSNNENPFTSLATSPTFAPSSLTTKDLDALTNLENLTAAPLAITEHTVKTGDKTTPDVSILATTPNLPNVLNLPMNTGNFIQPESPLPTAVLGSSLALHLFGSTHVLNRTIIFQNQEFIVTGVLSSQNQPLNFNNIDFDQTVIVDYDVFKPLDPNLQIQQINLKSNDQASIPALSEKVTEVLTETHSYEKNFRVEYGDNISHPTNILIDLLSTLLIIVASVSLVVGGIGIMNIMLVSVAERTREIGIRKAVGASSTQILVQFLLESLFLSFLGGLLGLLFGYVLSLLIKLFTSLPTLFSFDLALMSLIISLVIGIIFGITPAFKAARKDPISSLKYYR